MEQQAIQKYFEDLQTYKETGVLSPFLIRIKELVDAY